MKKRMDTACGLLIYSGIALATAISGLSGCSESNPPANAANPAPVQPGTNANTNPASTPQPASSEISKATPAPTTGGRKLGPRITFAKSTHSFGTIWDVNEQLTSFPFTNTGDDVLIIEAIKASCGCTTTKLKKMSYQPGEGSEIEVAFVPKGTGFQTKSITVVSNATNESTKRLTISADIIPIVSVDQTYLRFGAVEMGKEHTRTVTITGRYPNLTVEAINAPNSYFSAKLVDDEGESAALSDGPRNQYTIAVTLHANLPWGGFYSNLQIMTKTIFPDTGKDISHPVTVHVTASVFGEVHASDTMFRVSAVPLAKKFEKVVELTRPSGEPFKITSATIERQSLPGLTLSIEPLTRPGSNGYRLVLKGDPGSYQGPVNGRVLVITDIPGEKQFYLPIAGIVRKLNQ